MLGKFRRSMGKLVFLVGYLVRSGDTNAELIGLSH